jgi:hypothetical protein
MGGSGGSGGSGGAVADDEVCRAALGAICDRFATCAGSAAADPTTLARPCDNIAAACPDFFFNEASTRTVAGVTASVAELAALSCFDIDLGLRPASWTPGTSPLGATCARVSNCQSGACSGVNTQCGSCVGDMVATGESCAKGSVPLSMQACTTTKRDGGG